MFRKLHTNYENHETGLCGKGHKKSIHFNINFDFCKKKGFLYNYTSKARDLAHWFCYLPCKLKVPSSIPGTKKKGLEAIMKFNKRIIPKSGKTIELLDRSLA